MRKWFRQTFCVHWFDVGATYSYSESGGYVICCQQRTYTITVEPRTCSKCGLTETRRVGEPVYEGWV